MLLAPINPDGGNLFEGVIKGLFENRASHLAAILVVYDEPGELLCDRGFAEPIAASPKIMAMSFNLSSTETKSTVPRPNVRPINGRGLQISDMMKAIRGTDAP